MSVQLLWYELRQVRSFGEPSELLLVGDRSGCGVCDCRVLLGLLRASRKACEAGCCALEFQGGWFESLYGLVVCLVGADVELQGSKMKRR